MTYGVERDQAPPPSTVADARQRIRQQYGITKNSTVLCFNGAFGYRPNLDALHIILETILPLLEGTPDFSFTILVCGKDLRDRRAVRV